MNERQDKEEDMKNSYEQLREIQQERFNSWANEHMFFAFNMDQFREGMKKLGLDPEEDQDKIYRVPGGGYHRKEDAAALHEIIKKNYSELQEAIQADETGEGFIYEMFVSELFNHEYGYTEDLTDTLDALGLDLAEVDSSPALSHGLAKAAAYVREHSEF